MTVKRFSDALGNIGEIYIHEAVTYTQRKKNTWVKWVSIAACLSLAVMVVVLGSLFRTPDAPDGPDAPDNNVLSYFTITAHAANGESTDLALAEGCFNSAPAQQGNGFGVDMPLFHFSVTPSDLKNNEAIYDRFDVSVSYNGSYVKDKDEHISVVYLIPMQNTNEPWSYSIMGWFTESTDILINIVEKDSREIVETITVNVNYIVNRQEYELKITNLTTLFAEQREAVYAHNALISYFFSRGYVTNYPEWFGGCYIEENKLYIKLVSPSDEEMKNISQILAPFDKVVVYKNAEMSMADLQGYADKIANELINSGYEVTSWYVYSITGNIIIAVLEKDFEAVMECVDTALQSNNAPKIIIEIGEYTDVGLGNQVIEFCAGPLFENGAFSWMYSMNVKIDIDNGGIYLNDILFDQISYVEGIELDWGTPMSGSNKNEMMMEAISKISSQKGCYILETASESKLGQKIVMYVIGNDYYFIRFFDNGQVMRVHLGTVQ